MMIVRTVGHVIKTGIPFNVRGVHLWAIKQGYVAQFEAYLDTPAMLQALQQTSKSKELYGISVPVELPSTMYSPDPSRQT